MSHHPLSRRHLDGLFERVPWLVPPERWHPSAAALVAEARGLTWLIQGESDYGLEIWAGLGALTQAEVESRSKAASELSELVKLDESTAGWPVVSRCLLRLASAEVPGRFYAALELLDLVTTVRASGLHRRLLCAPRIKRELAAWDESLRVFRVEIVRRLASRGGAPTYQETMLYDELLCHAEEAERALDRIHVSHDVLRTAEERRLDAAQAAERALEALADDRSPSPRIDLEDAARRIFERLDAAPPEVRRTLLCESLADRPTCRGCATSLTE